jgi:hypothetical protein
VDTPRRTRTSVPRAKEYGVTPHSHVVKQFFWGTNGGVGLATVYDVGNPIPLTQQLGQAQHEHIGVGFRVIQNADTLVAQIGMPSGQGFGTIGGFRGGIE